MKTLVLSDCHVDIVNDGPEFITTLPTDCPLGLIAGDFSSNSDRFELGEDDKPVSLLMQSYLALTKQCPDTQFFAVPGNHEYWFGSLTSIDEELQRLEEMTSGRLQFIHCKTIRYKGITVHGLVNWYQNRVDNRWVDYHQINFLRTQLTDVNIAETAFLSEADMKGEIVLSHMLPSYRVVSENWAGHRNNKYFVSPRDSLLAEKPPKLWIHGHSHDPCDFMLDGQTRMYRTPRGYDHERVPGASGYGIIEL